AFNPEEFVRRVAASGDRNVKVEGDQSRWPGEIDHVAERPVEVTAGVWEGAALARPRTGGEEVRSVRAGNGRDVPGGCEPPAPGSVVGVGTERVRAVIVHREAGLVRRREARCERGRLPPRVVGHDEAGSEVRRIPGR